MSHNLENHSDVRRLTTQILKHFGGLLSLFFILIFDRYGNNKNSLFVPNLGISIFWRSCTNF